MSHPFSQPDSSIESKHGRSSGFQTTDWSALANLNTPEFAEALAKLCQQYWYPVYAFIRRRAGTTHRAEDLTQAFFCKVISLRTFRMADRERGRFRAFLLTSVKNFLASEFEASQAQKRGGDRDFVPFDFAIADQIYLRNRSRQPTPDNEFDRAWALSLIEHAIERLRSEYDRQGDRLRFDLLKPSLRSMSLDYPEIASQLEISEAAVRQAASRFRRSYGQQLRLEIAATLADDESIDTEIDWILEVLRET
ncbi:RNA polymerase sigma factor [Novipirellula sp. SH528]|uniref:RNA polymerase sigma factor n=1 Tax=Novipirellula sp. SH528 TaxID=3454466 RepID=UPI003FA0AC4C